MSDRSKLILKLATEQSICLNSVQRENEQPTIEQNSLEYDIDNRQSSLTTALMQDCLFEDDLLLQENLVSKDCQDLERNEIENESDPIIIDKEDIDDPLWNNQSTSDDGSEKNMEDKESDVENQEPETINVELKENTRKRHCNPDNWVRNVRKKKHNSGMAHTNSRNKAVADRKILGSCKENCKFECGNKINQENREQIFKRYWQIGDIHKQRSYILKHLSAIPHTRNLENTHLRKTNNAFYFEIDNQRIRVCKQFFIKTLGISDRMVRTVIEKNKDGILEDDKRGKHGHQVRVADEIKQGIRAHITSIPRIESHYLRAQTSREFIDGGKSLADIYRDYKDICVEADKSYGNYTMFSRIFRNEFNISFFVPKKDQCGTCEEYKNENEKGHLQKNYDRHLREKELSRAEKEKDKQAAKENECIAVCFDLQAVLQTPCGDINTFYYKSKLSTYNFTVFDLGTLNGFCYVWHEGEGSRGSSEIGSCLYSFFKNECSKDIPVVLYCDNCYGQNKNKFITSLLLYAVCELNIPSIALKFLIVGHTQNEGDNMHSLIEKQKKRVLKSGPIYTPAQWIPVISNAKKTGTPYKIKEMNLSDFYDLKQLQEKMGKNFVVNSEGEKVLWSDIVILKVFKNEPFTVYYKISYSDDSFKKILIRKATSRNSALFTDDIELKQLYDGPLKLSAIKLDGLSFLCTKNHIIPKYHDFYRSLGCKIDSNAITKKTQQTTKKASRKQ